MLRQLNPFHGHPSNFDKNGDYIQHHVVMLYQVLQL
jgi:hypothetical protein